MSRNKMWKSSSCSLICQLFVPPYQFLLEKISGTSQNSIFKWQFDAWNSYGFFSGRKRHPTKILFLKGQIFSFFNSICIPIEFSKFCGDSLSIDHIQLINVISRQLNWMHFLNIFHWVLYPELQYLLPLLLLPFDGHWTKRHSAAKL